MTATLLVIAAAVAMITDWWAVHSERRQVETIAKPLVMICLIVLAVVIDIEPASLRPWIIAALAFGLLGDVLLLPWVDQFIGGLAAFLIGHGLYVIAFSTVVEPGPWIAVGVVGLIALMAVFGRRIVEALDGSRLRPAVIAYVAVTGAVLLSGSMTGRALIVAGTLAFAASDGLLGANRFVEPAPQLRPVVHALYHLGQAAILAGATT